MSSSPQGLLWWLLCDTRHACFTVYSASPWGLETRFVSNLFAFVYSAGINVLVTNVFATLADCDCQTKESCAVRGFHCWKFQPARPQPSDERWLGGTQM